MGAFSILWTERDTFAFNGRYNQQRYVNIWPQPVQKPHPPVWLPGGGSIETWQWCAKMDDVYAYLSYFGYKDGRATMPGFWDEMARLGKDRNPYRAGFLQFVGVAESRDKAMELYRAPAEYCYGRCPRGWITRSGEENAMKYALGTVLLAGGLALALSASAADVLTLTSLQIQDNGTLAVKNACADKQRTPNCVGENVSPPLAWAGVPDGTKSFALLLFDPEGRAPAGVSHMVIYGIPADVKGFAEGELSKESPKFVGGKNLMGTGLYFGPGTPPNTDWHHYTWTLVATDLDPKAPELKPGMTREELAAALKDHVKGSAGLVTRFKHP